MVRLTRRLALYVGSLLALVAVYTVAYRWGMSTLEGETRTWYGALEIVVQSMTTTGYGQDAPWASPQMTVLMVVIQLTGITYLFVAFPLFVIPWLETLVEPSAPEEAAGLEDHIVIVGYTELCASLVDELESSDRPYVVLEADAEKAQELYDDGIATLHRDPATDEALEAAGVEDARAIVIDATEDEFISTILAIGEHNPDVAVLALIEDQSRARYLRYAGVDEVLLPKHRLGKALGDKIRGVVDVDLDGPLELGEGFHLAEYPIDRDSEFFAVPLEDCRRVERTGTTVLGAWVRGDFVTSLSADVHTDENTTVLVAGTQAQLDAVADRIGSSARHYRPTTDPVLVVGSGVTGSTVVGGLERAGLETVLVEHDDADVPTDFGGDPMSAETRREADVVGDPTTERILHEADIEDVRTVVITLADDDEAILTALVARELNPDAQILAALGQRENVSRLRAAGVDYVLALPNVAGRMATLTIFEGDAMIFDEQLRLTDVDASPIAGDRVDSGEIRAQTGCALVGLERDGTVHTDVDGQTLESGDSLVVAGTDRNLESLRERFLEVET
ncbi:potassium channel family protein [Natrialbaceae archaeon A-gly3]